MTDQNKAATTREQNLAFAEGRMLKPPCFVCGYNGTGYFQPSKHQCAAKHHKLYNPARIAHG